MERVIERPDLALDPELLVDLGLAPPGLAAIGQANEIVGIPAAIADPMTQVKGLARQAEPGGATFADLLADLVGQLRRHALVGIDVEYPVMPGLLRSEVLLLPVARPGVRENAGAQALGDLHRPVRAARVNDHDVIRPTHALDRARNVRFFVSRNDGDAKHYLLGHGRRK